MTVCEPGLSHDGGTTYTRRTSTSSSSGIPQFSQARSLTPPILAFFSELARPRKIDKRCGRGKTGQETRLPS